MPNDTRHRFLHKPENSPRENRVPGEEKRRRLKATTSTGYFDELLSGTNFSANGDDGIESKSSNC